MKVTKIKNTQNLLEVKAEVGAFYKTKELHVATIQLVTEYAINNKWIEQSQIDFVDGRSHNNKMEDICALYIFHKKIDNQKNVSTIKRKTNRKSNVKKDEK